MRRESRENLHIAKIPAYDERTAATRSRTHPIPKQLWSAEVSTQVDCKDFELFTLDRLLRLELSVGSLRQ